MDTIPYQPTRSYPRNFYIPIDFLVRMRGINVLMNSHMRENRIMIDHLLINHDNQHIIYNRNIFTQLYMVFGGKQVDMKAVKQRINEILPGLKRQAKTNSDLVSESLILVGKMNSMLSFLKRDILKKFGTTKFFRDIIPDSMKNEENQRSVSTSLPSAWSRQT